MIFARQTSDPLTSLVKKLDEATVKNKDKKLGSFCRCAERRREHGRETDYAHTDKEKIDQTILGLDGVRRASEFEVAKDADRLPSCSIPQGRSGRITPSRKAKWERRISPGSSPTCRRSCLRNKPWGTCQRARKIVALKTPPRELTPLLDPLAERKATIAINP